MGIHSGDHGRLAFEVAEQVLGVLPTRQLGGQIRREDLAHACRGQELADLGREAGEDLTHEVLGHRTLVTREGREKGIGVWRVPQGDRGEPERRGPPASQRVQCRDLGLVEVYTCSLEKLPGLDRGEAQPIDANLVQPPFQPEPGEGQRRVQPARQHQPQPARSVPEEDPQRILRFPSCQLVDVVEHQPDRLGKVVDGIDDLTCEVGDRCRGFAGELPQGAVVGHGGAPRHRGQHGTPEPPWVVVVLVERQPRRRRRRPMDEPVGKQVGLAVARRCADQNQCGFRGLVEQVEQARPRDEADRRAHHRLMGRNVNHRPALPGPLLYVSGRSDPAEFPG